MFCAFVAWNMEGRLEVLVDGSPCFCFKNLKMPISSATDTVYYSSQEEESCQHSDFFSATSDKIINTIKKELFDVADGGMRARACARVHARACMRVRACALCTHAHGARGRAGESVDGARCALITCAVCPGDFVLF
jgi:hypothetical protein